MHLITTHTQADLDALAAMLAVKKLYPQAVMAFSNGYEHNVREYLQSGALAAYRFLEPDQVDIDAVKTISIVDTRSSQNIGPFSRCLAANPKIHIFDHHPNAKGDIKGEKHFVEDYGATTTILVQLLEQNNISLTPIEATTLALGIYDDTGAMCHLTTTAADLHAAAWLVEQGARLDIINRYLRRELTPAQLEIIHELLQSAQSYTIQNLPVVVVSWASNKYIDDFTRILHQFMAMENLPCLCALISMAGRIYLSVLSSVEDINAGEIAHDFGGSGNRNAASAIIPEITLIQAQEQLIHLLHRHIRPAPIAKEMMSSPAITIAATESIAKAHKILVRYNITAAPVSDNGIIIGIISRQTVERARHHLLENRPVVDYMASDVATLSPQATLADIQEIIINNQQRIVPILEGKDVVGIITRTDLLNHLIGDPAHLPKKLRQDGEHDLANHRNLSYMMAESLDREMVLLLRMIGELAEKEHYTAYTVGGFVRDLLLGEPNLDLDIVIEGDGIAFAKSLAAHVGGRCNPHERFKTAIVSLPEEISRKLGCGTGFKIDVATARLEYYDSPAAMPTIELSSIKLDLYRRDFTINAMAIRLNPGRFGELIDCFHSQRDLRQKTIKTLHNLSFVEDPSRIFRAIRLEKRINFQLSPHTRNLIKNAVDMDFFGKGDDSRFLAELKLILSEKDPLPAIQRLEDFQLYQFLWPDIQPPFRIDRQLRQTLVRTQQALAWYNQHHAKKTCQQWMVYLLALMAHSEAAILDRFCHRFGERENERTFLLAQKQQAETAMQQLATTAQANSGIVTTLQEITPEGLLYMLAVADEKITTAVSRYIDTLQYVQPLITGKDLLKMGYTPGPEFSKMLDFLRMKKLDGAMVTKKDEEDALLRHFPLSEN